MAVVFAAHSPALTAGWIWDDDNFLTANPLIHASDGLYRLWFTAEAPDYFPLTSSMLWLEWRLWGEKPAPYHVGNVLLHGLACVLLWRVFKRLHLGSAAYLAAMLFAVHPVTVASVAWITERKNVLPMVLFLASLLAWLRYDEGRGRRWYCVALVGAVAALLAKTSVVMLPLVLLLLAWWKRATLTLRDAALALPFFVASAVLGLVTMWFQLHNAIGDVAVRPEGWASRIAAAGWIVWFYVYKLALPIRLAIVYPRWNVDGRSAAAFIPLALLLAALTVLWIGRRRWGRGPLTAMACYGLMLAPVAGFIDMSYMQYSLVADHLQYAAMPAMLVLAATAATAAVGRLSADKRRLGVGAISAVVLVLSVLTWRQARVYGDKERFWTHVIRHNPAAWVAYDGRGVVRNERGQSYQARGGFPRAFDAYQQALADFTEAISLKPDSASAHSNRGYTYSLLGDFERAIADLTRAIELRPDFPAAYSNRGNAYGVMGDYPRALADLDTAIRLRPGFAVAYGNRAATFFHMGRYDRAWEDVRECRRLGGTPNPELVRLLRQATGRSE